MGYRRRWRHVQMIHVYGLVVTITVYYSEWFSWQSSLRWPTTKTARVRTGCNGSAIFFLLKSASLHASLIMKSMYVQATDRRISAPARSKRGPECYKQFKTPQFRKNIAANVRPYLCRAPSRKVCHQKRIFKRGNVCKVNS